MSYLDSVHSYQYWRDADSQYRPGWSETTTKREANILFGYSDGTSVNYVAAALASGNMTLTLNGTDERTISITTQVGTDSGDVAKPEAGFVDSGTLGTLTPFTKYTYTATFGATTFTGQFYTAPRSGDDYCVYLNTCDRANTFSGHYAIMRDEIENGKLSYPVVASMMIDDGFGYVDTPTIAEDAAHTSTGVPSTTKKEYDYALNYLDGFGLFSSTGGWGLMSNRLWCLNHTNYIPQWGDHEFIDDFHGAVTPFSANQMHATDGGFDGGGYTAYAALVKPLQPPTAKRGGSTSTCNHWVMNYGEACFVAGDAITEANDGTTLLGTEQIEDILYQYDNTSAAFKVYLSGIRMSHTGSADSLKDEAIAEYNGFIRAKSGGADVLTGSSIMRSDKTNGTLGNFVTFSGDLHTAYTLKHQKTDAAYHTEAYLDNELGTITSSALIRQTAGATDASITSANEDSTVVYQCGTSREYTPSQPIGSGALLTVIGSTRFSELQYSLRCYGSDYFNITAYTSPVLDSSYSRKFVQYHTTNYGVDIAADLNIAQVGVSGKSGAAS